jgi:peptide deformylase
MLEILSYPHPHLKTVCEPVTEFGTHLLSLVNDMVITMSANGGIGLAANQVGLSQRIFVMNIKDSMKEYVNPEILEFAEEIKDKEGCLSFPGVFASVKRYNKIKVKAKTLMGQDIEEELTGLDAICFQHELDHLNGITFYDHLSPLQKTLIQGKMNKIKKLSKKRAQDLG